MRGSIVWLSERDSPDAFPPVDRALREPDGLLAAGGDLSPAAPARRVSTRHLSLVLARPADSVVVPGSARGAVSRPSCASRAASRKSMRNRGFVTRLDHRVSRRDPRLRQRRAAARRHLAVAGNACRLSQAAPARATRTRSRPGTDERLVGGLYGVALGRGVLRRIHVQHRARRLEGRAASACATSCIGARLPT